LAATKYHHPRFRVTLDTMDDYMLLCAVYDELYKVNRNFSAEEVIKLLLKKPWLNYINKESVQKKDSYDLNSEIIEGSNILKLQGMKRASEILLKHYKGGK
jgi:Spore coat polysaccharide biosynthesis protein F, CMP-KDO synthetase homolog